MCSSLIDLNDKNTPTDRQKITTFKADGRGICSQVKVGWMIMVLQNGCHAIGARLGTCETCGLSLQRVVLAIQLIIYNTTPHCYVFLSL